MSVSDHKLVPLFFEPDIFSTVVSQAALITHKADSEYAVVGAHSDLTGQAIHAFVSLKVHCQVHEDLDCELVSTVCKITSPFTAPKRIRIVCKHPKTQSGKNVCRILRNIVKQEL